MCRVSATGTAVFSESQRECRSSMSRLSLSRPRAASIDRAILRPHDLTPLSMFDSAAGAMPIVAAKRFEAPRACSPLVDSLRVLELSRARRLAFLYALSCTLMRRNVPRAPNGRSWAGRAARSEALACGAWRRMSFCSGVRRTRGPL